MENKVYIANYAGHPYDDAERFGKLVFITRGFVNLDNIDRLKALCAEKITESNESDYLLFSGASIICVISALLWLEKHNVIRMLTYDKPKGAPTGMYKEVVLTKQNLSAIAETFFNEPRG